MRFPDGFLEEIRARLPASEVIGRRVKLRRQGREFAGLSPFNQEKTPSFFVNDQKGRWFDFSAGRNGDIFTFLMETEGLSFPEAVERLAAEAGVPMPARDPGAEQRERQRATLYDVVACAAEFFEACLQSRVGAAARGYLHQRGVGPDRQRRFRIGYAPAERGALKEHLAARKFDHQQMVDAGLLVAGDDIPVSFDRFRDRVMFPISDFRGRIVAFGGRALSSDVPAKYLNSPETALFHKGALLYNGAEARRAVHDGDPVIVVEGYVDVVQMVAAGFAGTVAPLGTAVTEQQLQILWRMADEPILCFDGDGAGIRAAYRVADLALPLLAPGKSVRFALLPQGQDPDDLIRSAGPDAMRAVVAAARPLIDLVWGRETDRGVFDTPERRAALEWRLREVGRTIGDESVRRHYAQALAERVAAFFPDSRQAAAGKRRNRPATGRPADRGASSAVGAGRAIAVSERLRRSMLLSGRAAPPLREAVLIVALINHPGLTIRHFDAFAEVEFGSSDLARLRAAMLEAAADDPEADAAGLRAALDVRGFANLLARLDSQIAGCGLWTATAAATEEDAERGWLQALTLQRRQRTLHRELKAAEAALAVEPSEANLARLVDIQKQMANAEGTEALVEGFGASSGREARVY